MFGGFGKNTSSNDSDSKIDGVQTKKTEKSQSSVNHGFDPDSLERAAKAARELDSSKNAQGAIRIIHEQEVTKQKQSDSERAKFLAMQEQYAIQRVRESEEIAMRTLEEQSKHEKLRLEYRDQMERKRMSDQINAQRHLNDEERKKTEQSLQRQEEIRRKTLEHESQLREKTELAKVKAEYQGRILQERENHDLIIENKKIDAKEYRETFLEGIKIGTDLIGKGLNSYISDREKLTNTVFTLSSIAFGIYSAKAATGVTGRYIESVLGKPSLIRETSRINVVRMIKSPISSLKSYLKSKKDAEDMFLNNIILEKSLENRLKRLAKSTIMTKVNNSFYRNILLCGPPGTGKTLYAKSLARESGLHFAIMTGGDVAPLGKQGVTEIHKLFDWGNTTSKGLVLFIDEADAFLRKRSTETISEDVRNSLNAFLYRTGEASKKVVLVYASNQPEQLDWAINDRIDEIVSFSLPTYPERLRMINMYIQKYLVSPVDGGSPVDVSEVKKQRLEEVAKETEGFSGREISKLVISWQAAVYGAAAVGEVSSKTQTHKVVGHESIHKNKLTDQLLIEVLKESKASKLKKLSWLNKTEINNLTSDA